MPAALTESSALIQGGIQGIMYKYMLLQALSELRAVEYNNRRTALGHGIFLHGDTPEVCGRLSAAVFPFWASRGYCQWRPTLAAPSTTVCLVPPSAA